MTGGLFFYEKLNIIIMLILKKMGEKHPLNFLVIFESPLSHFSITIEKGCIIHCLFVKQMILTAGTELNSLFFVSL